MYKKILALDLTSGIINRVKHTEIEDKIARNIFFIKSILSLFLCFDEIRGSSMRRKKKKKKIVVKRETNCDQALKGEGRNNQVQG